MTVHILLVGIHRIFQLCCLEVKRIDDQTSLRHMNIFWVTIHKQLKGCLRLGGKGILPITVHLLQNLQMRLNGIAMSHRGVDIHIEEVLQDGRLRTHHSILIGTHLVLLLRLLIEINTQEHNDQGDDETDNNG